ncbi:MAG: methyltransferase domain-containing protein [Phycisphaerae bacterium]
MSDSLFDWIEGTPHFRGLRVERRTIDIAGRTFGIVALADAADLLDHEDYAKRFIDDDVAPYGLELWPASRMLAEAILRGEDGQGRSALELGCGLGLVSIAASVKNWRIVATDNELTSLQFAEYNARMNGAKIAAFETLDWHHPPTDVKFDRIFAADVLYQLTDHEPVLTCIKALLAPNGLALIADPNRTVADRFEELACELGFTVRTVQMLVHASAAKTLAGRVFHLHPRNGERAETGRR